MALSADLAEFVWVLWPYMRLGLGAVIFFVLVLLVLSALSTRTTQG